MKPLSVRPTDLTVGKPLRVLQLFGSSILGFFVQDAEKDAIVRAGMGFVRVVTPFYLMVCSKVVYDGALRGVGAMTPFMLVAVSDVVARILCGRLFSNLWGIWGVWAVWPVAWFVGTVMSFWFYQIVQRKNKIVTSV